MLPDISTRKSLNILSIDPGITTGICIFSKGKLFRYDVISYDWLETILTVPHTIRPERLDYIIIESFRLYAHKAKSLTNDAMITSQIIGKLKDWFKDFKIVEQSASQAKGFWTDAKLKEAGCYVKNRHCRDAVRHGLYALYFNKEVI